MELNQAGAALRVFTDGPHILSSWAAPTLLVPGSLHLHKINTIITKMASAVPYPSPLPRARTDLGEKPSATSATVAAEAGAGTAWPSLNPWPLYWRQEMNKS